MIGRLNRLAIWGRHYVAVTAVAVALIVRYLLIDRTNEDTTFLAAVIVAAVVGGLLPGLLAAALSGAVIWIDYPILFHDSDHPLATIAFFGTVSLLISTFCELLKSARRKSDRHAREAAMLRDRIISISEAEQRRIGHDLHDNVGQQLTGIALLGQSLARRLARRDAPEADDARRIVAMVSETVGWTRDLARGLTPVAMEADDLVLALQRLAQTASSMFKTRCEFRTSDPPPVIPPHAAIHLYRIAQEAVTNAAKHAQGTEVVIELDGGERGALRVRDNGRGFDSAAVSNGGLGLEIMSHRARLIDAELVVRPAEDGGTLVCCRLGKVRSGAEA